ncbi:DMT family transporter [Sinorhizobium terangae]|uniref:EamA/RhaT family transporter n=1 Tax=Sinorhizobium terangae TaxID=110322 RepID=A0A6N7LCK2_SINTE|nr:DMT family transporter [Sinorhizobium terangae]MBB4185778.1 drug/metabolite transporter (DMT)-like permease [Sinorhizobium terangae]MQX15577.1 EamA/RhaT family transporter [Sinorhizobium terangae]WFU46172.1 DMT family transporter [Sinorhizobium terangae]
MTSSMMIGVAAALFAAFAWSLNFVVPFVIGDYSVFDFALFRFVISGVLGLGFLAFAGKALRGLRFRDLLTTAWLGFIGYLGYFLTVVGAAIFAGPVIAPAFLAFVPVVLAIVGNLRRRSAAWSSLILPLTLAVIGLSLVNVSVFDAASMATTRSLSIGIPLAIAAVLLWTWFGIANESALAKRPGMDAGIWTALIMTGGGIEMLAFMPVGLALGVFEIPRLGLGWDVAAPLYLWGTGMALLASVGAAWAWTIASQRLPVALSAQLIVSETVFGTLFGLAVHGRSPTVLEIAGIAALTAGVLTAVRAFHGGGRQSAVA